MAFIEVSKGTADEFDVSVSISEQKDSGQYMRIGIGREARKSAFPDAGRVAVEFGYGKDFGKVLLHQSMTGYSVTGGGPTKSVSVLLGKAGIKSDAMASEVVKYEINPKGQMVITLPESVVSSWELTSYGKRRQVLAKEADTLNATKE